MPAALALTIEERQVGEVTLLELDGRLTLGEEADALGARLERLLKAKRNRIVLRLAKLTRLDSVGIGTMLGALKTARAGGGDVRILQPSKQAGDVLDLLGLKARPDILRVFQDENEALASFESPAPR